MTWIASGGSMAFIMVMRVYQRSAALAGVQAGFSLVELLTVLVVMGVLMGITVPSLNGMLDIQRANALSSTFVNSLNFARNESIKRNARAVVCKSTGGLDCSTSGGWERGWIVFHDINNNAAVDVGETVVLHQGAVSSGPRLTGNAPVANYVSYSPSGSAKLTSGAFQAGTFTLCPPASSGAEVRLIILSGAGRPRVLAGSPSDCS